MLGAEADGWLGAVGTALDVSCGLGSEVAYLARAGWKAVGIDGHSAWPSTAAVFTTCPQISGLGMPSRWLGYSGQTGGGCSAHASIAEQAETR